MKKIHIILMVLAITILGVVLFNNNKNKWFIEDELTYNGNQVVNYINNPMYDTIISHSLIEAEVTGTSIYVREIGSINISNTDVTNIRGAVGTLSTGELVVFLDELNRADALTVIPHEIIHVKQHSTKDLIVLDANRVVFKNTLYDLRYVDYDARPWEIEAYEQGAVLTRKLEKKIYK